MRDLLGFPMKGMTRTPSGQMSGSRRVLYCVSVEELRLKEEYEFGNFTLSLRQCTRWPVDVNTMRETSVVVVSGGKRETNTYLITE